LPCPNTPKLKNAAYFNDSSGCAQSVSEQPTTGQYDFNQNGNRRGHKLS